MYIATGILGIIKNINLIGCNKGSNGFMVIISQTAEETWLYAESLTLVTHCDID